MRRRSNRQDAEHYMYTGILQSLVILLTGLVYYLVDVWLIHHYGQRRAEGGTGRSWGYTAFMVACIILLVMQPMLLPGLGLRLDSRWGLAMQGLGVFLIAGGLALHWWARAHLRHFYVEDVQFSSDQQLVDTGPYRYVRHPVFTSFFLIAAGLLLVNPAVPTLLLCLYAFVDFGRAARREEALLTERLPEYAGYMRRTGRFLPKCR
jgi:protein-S-isoprenylcysteine O-methyltransferase Ste14